MDRFMTDDFPSGSGWVSDVADSTCAVFSTKSRLSSRHLIECLLTWRSCTDGEVPWPASRQAIVHPDRAAEARVDAFPGGPLHGRLFARCQREKPTTRAGAELALVLGAQLGTTIGGIVAVAPSHVVWFGLEAPGLDPDRRSTQSSWSLRGVPLPFLTCPPVVMPAFYEKGLRTDVFFDLSPHEPDTQVTFANDEPDIGRTHELGDRLDPQPRRVRVAGLGR